SQELHDRKYQIYFLHDLGNFLTMAGEFNRARQAFQEALELAPQVNHANAWFPLCGLAHIAHIQGEYDTALDFSNDYLRRCREGSDTRSLVIALHLHSFYARLNGKLDQAYADTSLGLQLLTGKLTGAHRLQLQVEAEFARVQGHYTQSREYIETLASIIEEKCDLYMLADTLFDQACYAQQQRQHEDVRNLAQRVIQVATHIGSPHFQSRSIQLLQQLPPHIAPMGLVSP
ncbi:MAG TPA: tetratricopeptide repeat protein, partial [Ktedonobacteraceae bacterium]|nr:tetratricopeptide repeat protein [Ktedonobacteraceae bacterium]